MRWTAPSSPSRTLRAGAWLGWMLSSCILATQSARADGGVAGGWIVVAIADTQPHLADALNRASALELELRAVNANLVTPEEARARFVTGHSTEPVTLPADRLNDLRVRVRRAARQLALGRARETAAELAPVRALGDQAQDCLRRDLDDAHELFDVCIVSASQSAQAGEPRAAERQMQECVRAFPSMRAPAEYHSQETRELFARVASQLQRGPVASLVIRNSSQQACVTRINGVPVGPAPAAVELLPATVRIQLECDDAPGRIHHVSLRSGFNEVTLDPDFDRSIVSSPPRMRILYASAARLETRRASDMAALARGVRAETLLVVEASAHVTVQRFDGSGRALQRFDWSAPAEDTAARANLVRALLAPPARPPQPPPVAVRRSAADDSAAWITPTAIALGYSTAVAASLFSLARRAGERSDSLGRSSFDIDGYRSDLRIGLIGTSAGAVLATSAEVIGLPQRASVPWWAWTAGGLGAAALMAGALLSPPSECRQMAPQPRCTTWQADSLLRPLLLIHSVPLLALPLKYAVSATFGVDASANAEGEARVQLRGRF